MPQIEGGRWDSLLRRLFGISDYGPSPGLSSEIVPTAVAQEWQGDQHFLRGELLAQGIIFQAAVAGQLSQISLFNETANILCVVHKIYVRDLTAAADVNIGFDALPAGSASAAQNKVRRDNRATARPTLNLYRTTNVATAFGSANFVQHRVGNVGEPNAYKLEGPWILAPQQQPLIIECQTANNAMTVAAYWLERVANPAELRLV